VHLNSNRASEPFIAVNCGAFNADLLSNELFGHEKGAFTGATSAKKGLIEAASGGTLLLDEITEMSPAMQVKLLRVIQEQEVLRLGATKPVKVDVRFIAASNPRHSGIGANREGTAGSVFPPERGASPHPSPLCAQAGHPLALPILPEEIRNTHEENGRRHFSRRTGSVNAV